MGGLYHCIFACTQLGNSTGGRTATVPGPLLLTGGPERYEAVLHDNYLLFLCVRRNICTGLDQINVSECCTWRDKLGMERGACSGVMGVNPVFAAAAIKSGLGMGGEEGRNKRGETVKEKSSQQNRRQHYKATSTALSRVLI